MLRLKGGVILRFVLPIEFQPSDLDAGFPNRLPFPGGGVCTLGGER